LTGRGAGDGEVWQNHNRRIFLTVHAGESACRIFLTVPARENDRGIGLIIPFRHTDSEIGRSGCSGRAFRRSDELRLREKVR
jgi:hypothetical protein